MAQSANSVWLEVKETVERLLKENPDYKLVLTGESTPFTEVTVSV